MFLLHCAGVKDHLHDSENRPRSPFDSSNFVGRGVHSNHTIPRQRIGACVASDSADTYSTFNLQNDW